MSTNGVSDKLAQNTCTNKHKIIFVFRLCCLSFSDLKKPIYAGDEQFDLSDRLIDDDVGSCVPANTLDKLFVVLHELMEISHIELLFKPGI